MLNLKSKTVSAWTGIRNTVKQRNIPDNSPWDAVDLDLGDSGDWSARRGHRLSLAQDISHTYNSDDGKAYVVSGGTLKEATLINDSIEMKEIGNSKASSFCDHAQYLWTNDGLQVHDGKATNIKIPVPARPSVSVTTGSMPPGIYNVVVTQVSGNGMMSGSTAPITVELKAQGGISVFPVIDPGYMPRIWMTEALGDEKAGGEVYYDGDEELPEIYLVADEFPKPGLIEWWDSRLCMSEIFSAHTVVRYSHRSHYHLWDYGRNQFVVPGEVLYMRSVPSGLVMVTGSEIYVTDFIGLTKLADYGCPAGESIVKHPDKDLLYIFSKRGICTYSAGGFANETEKKCSLPIGGRCSVNYVHQRGIQQLVCLHDGGETAFNRS